MNPDSMVLNGFLFRNISNETLATKGNMPTRQRKGFVRIVNFSVDGTLRTFRLIGSSD
jgi:hypothetical protein